MSKQYVIVGNGIAGLTAAQVIRSLDREGQISLIGEESHLTYSRPMLSKAPLRGFSAETFTVKPEKWYREQRIMNLLSAKVTALESEEKKVELATGEKLPYDECILATGAESFVPPIKGSDKDGVFVVRRLEDMENIRTYRLKARTAVVIGGGVIGLEIAWELKKSGLQVVVLELAKCLMERLLDSQSSAVLERIVKEQGIGAATNVRIREILGENSAEQVTLEDGRVYPADMVILSCGIRANSGLAKAAGIETNRGILVNNRMQTSTPHVYACGDCAEFNGVNLAIWKQAATQARVAAMNCVGMAVRYAGIKSDLVFEGLNTSMFMIGDAGKNPEKQYEEIVRENQHRKEKTFMLNFLMPTDYSYEKYFFAEGKLVGAVLIGNLHPMQAVQRAVKKGMPKEKFLQRMDFE